MNYYYEFSTSNGIEYRAEYGKSDILSVDSLTFIPNRYGGCNLLLLQLAGRVWAEDGDVVSYAKNRYWPGPVDMKEFLWIKLKC